MFNIKNLLGLGSKVGIEAIKENFEKDLVNFQISTLEDTLVSQIKDNNEDIDKIVELREELNDLQLSLDMRNEKYERLLEVLS